MSHATEAGFDSVTAGARLDERLATLRRIAANSHEAPYGARLAALGDLSQALLDRRDGIDQALGNVGLAFLAAFLQPSNLEEYIRREVPHPAALEQWVDLGCRKTLRILPRGVVCHWIAGNVPLLGMFSWALSALLGNCNALRLSSRQADTVSPLLRLLAATSPAGRQMAEETVVCFFDRDDRISHEQLSAAADIRIAWGGSDAIEAVRGLRCRWDCDDIVMGPRVSLAVVEPELCSPSITTRLATDIVYFDQAACSSPQVIFVRGRPGDLAVEAFLDRFEAALRQQTRRFARHTLDFAETYQIELDRTRVLMSGGHLRRDDQTRWSVAVLPEPLNNLACTNCFVQVVPVADWEPVYAYLPENVQTVVCVLAPDHLAAFSERAARRGACRFPAPGAGNHFDVPWDGIPLVSRLTRWVVRTEPAPGVADETPSPDPHK
jgi:hypothetical protein